MALEAGRWYAAEGPGSTAKHECIFARWLALRLFSCIGKMFPRFDCCWVVTKYIVQLLVFVKSIASAEEPATQDALKILAWMIVSTAQKLRRSHLSPLPRLSQNFQDFLEKKTEFLHGDLDQGCSS